MDSLLFNTIYIGLGTIAYSAICDVVRRVRIMYERELAGKSALTINGDFSKFEQLLVEPNRSDLVIGRD